MRLCLVSLEYPPETGWGGIGTETYHKAQGLSERGREVHVVAGSWERKVRTYRDGRVVIHRVPIPEHGALGNDDSPARWLAYSLTVAQKLHELQRESSFDLFHFADYGSEGFIYQTGTFRHRTARYALQLHGPLAMIAEDVGWPERDHPLYQIGCFMEEMVIRNADLVLASSHNTAAFSAERYKYPLDRIHVIHSAVDTSMFRPMIQPADPRHPRILFVGKLIRGKGVVTLTEAVLRLRNRYPNVRLRLVGKSDYNLLADVQQMITSAHAEDSFEFTGKIPFQDLPGHYAWCDVFAGPSLFEPGPGIVYLEAMSCGKPVVACNTDGTAESVVDKQVGLLVPPGDAGALEEALLALAEDSTLRQRLGQNGRARVEQLFGLERYITQVECIYRKALA